MKPLVIYVDDEPHNLTVMEAALPAEWEIHTFDAPLKALDFLTTHEPWVVISDQRMPGMTGVSFLEIIRRTHPSTKRILVTGYSDEDLIIESVRKAQVHDYIRKPWDVDDLEHRVSKMVETFLLENELKQKIAEIQMQNSELLKLTEDLKKHKSAEEKMRIELEAWAPPFILNTLFSDNVNFPLKKDLAVITFDIVGSSSIHDIYINSTPVRALILKAFSELVIKHGGYRESTAGDSAYAHFGLVRDLDNSADAALAVATEFRVFLRSFCNKHTLTIECGIGLHYAVQCLVDLHTIKIQTPSGLVTQKSFDSTSSDIDLVHRIEHLTHVLPGSNIAISDVFLQKLNYTPTGLKDLGLLTLKGQSKATKVYLKPSDQVNDEHITSLLHALEPSRGLKSA